MAEQEHDEHVDDTGVDDATGYEPPHVEDLESADGPAVTAAGVTLT